MDDYEVLEFSIVYKGLDLKILKNNPDKYYLGILIMLLSEFRKGYKFKKIGEATKNGTSIKYVPITNVGDVEVYNKKLIDMFNDCKSKFHTKKVLSEYE